MAGAAVRESATFAGRADQVREARAFVGRLLGPSHPCSDVAVLLASEMVTNSIRGLSYTLGGLGLLADAGTVISPQDSGTLGNADRLVAGTNGLLITLDLATGELPVVGEITLAATGMYLAGDFLYHHFTPFHDVADEVGHATVRVTDGLVHGAKSAWHSVTSTIGSWF